MTIHITPKPAPTASRELAELALAKMAQHADTMPYWKVLLQHGNVRRTCTSRDRLGPARQCYANAMKVAIGEEGVQGDLRYTEGLAYIPRFGMLFEHAWVEDAAGVVHETTWEDPTGIVYIGIQFDLAELFDAQMREPGPMIWGDYARKFEVLRAHERCCELEPLRR